MNMQAQVLGPYLCYRIGSKLNGFFSETVGQFCLPILIFAKRAKRDHLTEKKCFAINVNGQAWSCEIISDVRKKFRNIDSSHNHKLSIWSTMLSAFLMTKAKKMIKFEKSFFLVVRRGNISKSEISFLVINSIAKSNHFGKWKDTVKQNFECQCWMKNFIWKISIKKKHCLN